MRVTFRAQFQGRKGSLATPGFTFKNPPIEEVEVFRKADKWFARATTGTAYKLPDGPTKGTMTDTVEAAFEKQVSKWQMYGPDGQPIDPDSVEEDPKGNFTMKELTHVGASGPHVPSKHGANCFHTFCGQEVHVRQIRSTRHHSAPSCPSCKAQWEKTPANERFSA